MTAASTSDRGDGSFRIRNAVRERVTRGEVALGIGVRAVRGGEIAQIAASTGHDFLYIDVQHALFDLAEIARITQVALGLGVAPFVRTRSATDPDIPVLLDAGVLGIVAPDVVSADQARALVDASKYAPLGRRSLAGMSVHNLYRPVPVADQMRAENDAVMVFCMIESVEGLAAIDEIGAVPGLDGLYLGLNDLLASLGKPGRFDDDAVDDALSRLAAVTSRYGLVAGAGGAPSPALQSRTIGAGVRFLMSSSDIGLVRAGALQALERIRTTIDGAGVGPAEGSST